MVDRPYDSTQFAYKEKLRKCILEWRSCVSWPFSVPEASKWIESYFRRSGNTIRTTKPLLDFIIAVELISIVETNKSAKYFFNGERISQFFDNKLGTEVSPLNSSRKNGPLNNNGPGTFIDRQPENMDAISSFEKTVSRLNDLLCMQQGALVEYLKKHNVVDGRKSELKFGGSAPHQKEMLVDSTDEILFQNFIRRSGLNIKRNEDIITSENKKEVSSKNHLIDPVAMACLRELAGWPNDMTHTSDVCRNYCPPHRILSASLQCLAKREAIGTWIPTPIQFIFDLISSRWSCFGNGNHQSHGGMANSPGNCTNRDSPSLLRVNNKVAAQTACNPCLPPLATPVGNHAIPFVDESCRPAVGTVHRRTPFSMETRTTVHDLFESSDSYYSEVIPFTPLASVLRNSRVCSDQTTSTHQCLELPNAFASPNHGQIKEISKPQKACSPECAKQEPEAINSAHQFTGIHVISSSKSDSNFKPLAVVPSFVKKSIEDITSEAIHLALLFLSPGNFDKLRELLIALRRIISNHRRLTDPLLLILTEYPQIDCSLSCAIQEAAKDDSEEGLLSLLSCLFMPLMFGTPGSTEKSCWSTQKSSQPFCQIFRYLLRQTDWNFMDFQLTKRSTNANCQNAVCQCSIDLLPLAPPIIPAPISRQQLEGIPLPMCITSIASAASRAADCSQRYSSVAPSGNLIPRTHRRSYLPRRLKPVNNSISSLLNAPNTTYRWASTPRATDDTGDTRRSAERSPTTVGDIIRCTCEQCATDTITTGWWRPGGHECGLFSERSSSANRLTYLSCHSQSSDLSANVDRVNSLGNTAHLINLLNQIIDDRQMEPSKKLRCLLEFRKVHADVYWLRFKDQSTEAMYLAQLNRRIHLKSQRNVIHRISNALRRLQIGK